MLFSVATVTSENVDNDCVTLPKFCFVLFDSTKFNNKYLNFIPIKLKDDEDGHLVVLIIIEELMSKTKDDFLDHFARLGIFSKVQALMGNNTDSENTTDVIKSSSTEGGSSISSSSLVKGIKSTIIVSML